jgi:hypothetical protein
MTAPAPSLRAAVRREGVMTEASKVLLDAARTISVCPYRGCAHVRGSRRRHR